jgi:hypothetical protein
MLLDEKEIWDYGCLEILTRMVSFLLVGFSALRPGGYPYVQGTNI